MSEERIKKNLPSVSSKRVSEIRIILIGGREYSGQASSGKSSTGNIILGTNAFEVGKRTARSVKAEADVHGRRVTVVDTPGWWWHYSVENTPKFDRLEIMRSPTLCLPGPHAFLLVIPLDHRFSNDYRMALEEQLEYFSEHIWRHIIVLFSSIAPHEDRSVKDQLIKWPDLQMVLRKCQNRYHVLNINNRDDRIQVITLLEKIDEMVAQNNHSYLIINKSISVEDKKEKAKKERIKKRILAVKRQGVERPTHIKSEEQHLTDIHIVMVGALSGAKSSAGNLILGNEVFQVGDAGKTSCCEVSHAEVHGRMLTVVDTPGWFCKHPLESTPVLDKLEIRHSVYLSPPGPHAILLTVPIVTAFNKSIKIALEEHMGLLGKKVWSHTIVLFTWGDWLGETTIEERIEVEGEHLEWLMEQCGYRYHVFNSKQHTDSTQVTELLEKIDKMVMENNDCHYVPDEKINPSTELKLKLKKSKINMMKVRKQKDILQELLKERKNNLSDVRIVLLGAEGVGKSLSGNTILQNNFFEMTLEEAFKVQRRTRQCVMKQSKVEGCHVSVVDTPGWSTSNLENAKEILRSVQICSPGPHAFLLVLPLDKTFTKKSEQTVMELMSLFGEHAWRHTIIIFFGLWLKDRPVEQYIACEGEALQKLIKKCGNRYHVLTYLHIKSHVLNLLEMVEDMVTRNRGEYFTLENGGKKATSVFRWFTGKLLTEEEWNKREDELIERMLEAAVADLDQESKHPSARRKGSFGHVIPSMSGDSLYDTTSSVGAGILSPADKVSRWLRHPRNKALSSGYDTMSTASSFQELKPDSNKDIPLTQNHLSEMDTPKYTRNTRKQKHTRSFSI
ncbi:GTPase IMAP family member 8 [Puntigrus tetrazona]|uniref:GTPase IMAP family member 8 n=1 Tax=Puntigrus tetrazona TaxID=1606681 RepID=UPI001C8ADF4D|nr:GTPase IMAP family member 8 [Puntigrus tetrazona]